MVTPNVIELSRGSAHNGPAAHLQAAVLRGSDGHRPPHPSSTRQ